MKILFIINTIAYPGGAERVMTTLANEYSKENEVFFLTSWKVNDEYCLSTSIYRENIFGTKPTSIGFIKKNFISVRKMRTFIKKNQIDIVISFCTENNIRMLVSSLGLKCKKIISIRNDPKYEFPNILIKSISYSLFLTVDSIVFQTKDAMNFFPEFIKKKGKVICNPIDSNFFEESNVKRKQNIISMGRFAPQKNNMLLINAFDKIKNETDYSLFLYGEGVNEKILYEAVREKGLRDRVNILPRTNNVKEVFDNASIFVLSSDFEGMPNALMEAMASGLACISTDCPCGGPRELIKNGVDGLLINVNDVNDLSHKLLYVIKDEEQRMRLMRNAKESSKKYRIEEIVKEWNELL